MLPLLIQLILAVFATFQVGETIRHGSLFERSRAWIESRGPFWADLIGCGFCFSHWSSGFIVFVLLTGHHVLETLGWSFNPFLLVLVWLAVTRGANLLNDLTKSWSRTPSGDTIEIIEMEDEDFIDD